MSAPNAARPLLTGGEALRVKSEVTRRGGGPKKHPQTPAQAAALLRPQVAKLRSELQALPDYLVGRNRIFQMSRLPEYRALSYSPQRLLAATGLVIVGGRAERQSPGAHTNKPNQILMVAGPLEAIRNLQELMATSHDRTRWSKGAYEQLRQFSEVRLRREDDILTSDREDVEAWEAVLHPGGRDERGNTFPLDDDTFAKWVSWIDHLGGEVIADYRGTEGGLTFVPVRLPGNRAREAASFNPLRVLRPMPAMRPLPEMSLRRIPRVVLPTTDPQPVGNHTVAVFDGGLQPNALDPNLARCTDLTPLEPEQEDCAHGTGVTGAVVFGLITPGQQLPQPAGSVHHYRVEPAPTVRDLAEPYWTLRQIEHAIRSQPVPLVNLSLGPALSMEDREPNRWTTTLDRVAVETGALIVTAAGNNGEHDHETGLNRVQVPADMANGISVGSCDTLSEGWNREPYSAIGPGRVGSQVQPFGLQFGGNPNAGRPFYALQSDRRLLEIGGTSFACPLVVNSLSKLRARLGGEGVSSETLRAFAAHFAEPHADDDTRNETGYGRLLLDYSPVLECHTYEVHVLYRDRLACGSTALFSLPVPTTVTSGRVEISLSLAYISPIQQDDPMNYTKAGIELAFRPHSKKFRFSNKSTTRLVDVEKHPAEAAALGRQGCEISRKPVTKSLRRCPRPPGRFVDNGKWETVRRLRVSMNASSLKEPILEMSYLARHGTASVDSAEDLAIALLVTIGAPKTPTLYDDVRAEFPVLKQLGVEAHVDSDAPTEIRIPPG